MASRAAAYPPRAPLVAVPLMRRPDRPWRSASTLEVALGEIALRDPRTDLALVVMHHRRVPAEEIVHAHGARPMPASDLLAGLDDEPLEQLPRPVVVVHAQNEIPGGIDPEELPGVCGLPYELRGRRDGFQHDAGHAPEP